MENKGHEGRNEIYEITSKENKRTYNTYNKSNYPGQVIRPVDPIVFDRIRVGFHRNPTSFIKNRSDPTRFLSDSFRSESGPDFIGIQRNPMKSYQIRPGFHRVPSNSGPDSDRKESDKNRVGSDRNIQIRQDPIPPL